jgi:hypothetical protein
MTVYIVAKRGGSEPPQARDAGFWLRLAAAPTFALMAWVSADAGPRIAICGHAAGWFPLGDMPLMYLLMALFHASPWLKLAFGRKPIPTPKETENA